MGYFGVTVMMSAMQGQNYGSGDDDNNDDYDDDKKHEGIKEKHKIEVKFVKD
jgi:hypothetical protein